MLQFDDVGGAQHGVGDLLVVAVVDAVDGIGDADRGDRAVLVVGDGRGDTLKSGTRATPSTTASD